VRFGAGRECPGPRPAAIGCAETEPDKRGEKERDERDTGSGLEHYLTVAAALFVIGIFGIFLNRKNVIILLMSIELMLWR
jgi:hypothetical protein